jgi:hypothetical protein
VYILKLLKNFFINFISLFPYKKKEEEIKSLKEQNDKLKEENDRLKQQQVRYIIFFFSLISCSVMNYYEHQLKFLVSNLLPPPPP